MAVDMFLFVDSVKGESQDEKHADEIDVLAWSWGMSQTGTMHTGKGGGAGKVNIQDISLTKYVDKSSPTLMKYCCQGKNFTKAMLTVRKAGGEALEYIVIKMEGILISSVSTGGSSGEEQLTENVTLNFAKVTFEYTEQNNDGTPGAMVPVTHDIQKNVTT